MTSLYVVAPLLLGASAVYLFVVAWSFRASKQHDFSLLWLLVPFGGALLAGITLALVVPVTPSASLSLRLLELAAHLCTVLLIWTIVGNIAPAHRLAGTLLYAWNPLVLIELAVYANTAGVVACLLLLAVTLLLTSNVPPFRRGGGGVDDGRGRLRRPRPLVQANSLRNHMATAGDASVPLRSPSGLRMAEIVALVLVGLAMRINFLTLLLAPLLLWWMVRHRRGMSAALIGFAWRALVVLAVFVLAYLPEWRGSETFLAITNGLRLFDFANSPLGLVVTPVRSFFTFVAQRAHFPPLMQPGIAADMTVLATSFFLFALLYLREMGRVRARIRLNWENTRATTGTHPDRLPRPVETGNRVGYEEGAEMVGLLPYDVLFTGWAIVIVGYIVLAATVFLPGYIVWGVWVVALRRFDTLSVCVLLLSCSALLYYPLQWFALVSTGFLVPLCVFGIPLVYLVVQYSLPAGRMERKKVLK